MAENEIHVPGYYEAVESEQRDRSVAFLELPELIAGVKVAPLTPYRREWLRSLKNPFVIGGEISAGAVWQFLWCVHPDFCADAEKRDAFIGSTELILDDAVLDIEEYLERAFLDEPTGGRPGIPYYSGTAYLIHAMRTSYQWDTEKTLHSPLRVIYQLLRCVSDSAGAILINKRSDKITSDWLAHVNSITNPEERAEFLEACKQ